MSKKDKIDMLSKIVDSLYKENIWGQGLILNFLMNSKELTMNSEK